MTGLKKFLLADLLTAAIYLLHLLAFHGPTDVNHENQVLSHVSQVLGGEEVSEVVIGHLKQRRVRRLPH